MTLSLARHLTNPRVIAWLPTLKGALEPRLLTEILLFWATLNGFLVTFSTIFTSYLLKSVIPNFVACLVFLRMAFSFINLISSSTKREAAIMKICPPAIITSAEVIIAEYDAILGQWKRENFYNHLGNYTKILYSFSTTSSHWCKIKRKKKILPQLLLISQSDWLICRGK